MKLKILYDHVNLVRSKLGIHIELIPYEIECKLINMFTLVQTVYYKNASNIDRTF